MTASAAPAPVRPPVTPADQLESGAVADRSPAVEGAASLGAGHALLLLVAGAACVLAPIGTVLGAPWPLRAPAGLALFCLAPGIAILALLKPRDAVVELGLVLATSLGVMAIAAQLMLWLHAWEPAAATWVIAALCLPPIVAQARRHTARLSSMAVDRSRAVARRVPHRRVPGSTAAHGGVISVAMLCWATALPRVDLAQLSGYGLLTALPPTYYAALVLLAGGFAVAATRRRLKPRLLVVYALALVAVLYATAPILYSEPRYTWTYRHVGVIDYIAAHGAVDRSIDIYHNWPAFFALDAWLSAVTGVAPVSLARWAQPFFELANMAAVVFALRGVTHDARLRWTAAWLFLVANWIGQDYLAPQAFGFVLCVVVIGLAIRLAAAEPRGPTGLIGKLGFLGLGRADDRPRDPGSLSSRATHLVGSVCYLAVVLSHQLSPLFAIAGVAALVLTTGRPRLRILAVLVAVEAWWVWRGFEFLSAHFDLLDVGQTASARPVGPDSGQWLPGAVLGADLSRAVIVAMGVLAVAGIVRRARAGHRDVVPAALAVAPLLVGAAQSYDGEGPLRAYLFALPWLAFFAAAACAPTANAVGALRRGWRPFVVSTLVGVGSLFGYFGQDLINAISPSDVAASRWLLDHAPRGSSVTVVAANFPDRLNARYPIRLDTPRSLTAAPQRLPLGRYDLSRIEALLRDDDAARRFLALSPSQEHYARFYGLLPEGSFARFSRALLGSSDFRLVYRRGPAQIFLFVPPTTAIPGRPRAGE